MSRILTPIVFVCIAIAAACTPAAAPPPAEVEVDTAAIRAKGEARMAALENKDIDGYLEAYAEDAVWMPQDAPPVIGKERARQRLEAVLADQVISVETETREQMVLGADWVLNRGTYQAIRTSEGKEEISQVGSYVVLWGRGPDGAWTIHQEISNADTAPIAE